MIFLSSRLPVDISGANQATTRWSIVESSLASTPIAAGRTYPEVPMNRAATIAMLFLGLLAHSLGCGGAGGTGGIGGAPGDRKGLRLPPPRGAPGPNPPPGFKHTITGAPPTPGWDRVPEGERPAPP